MLELSSPLTELNGLGSTLAGRFAERGIYTLEQLLFLLPKRYQNKTYLTRAHLLAPGKEVLFEARVLSSRIIFGRKRQLVCSLSCEGLVEIKIRFFHFNPSIREQFVRGNYVQCFGRLLSGREGLEMHHPEFRSISGNQKPLLEETLTPVYPTVQGVRSWVLKNWIADALKILENTMLHDPLKGLSDSYPDIATALRTLHRPSPLEDLNAIYNFRHPAQERLILDEFCAYQLSLRRLRLTRQHNKAAAFVKPLGQVEELYHSLGFALTTAQKRCLRDIFSDLQKVKPMLRLLQGDVGSGKTIVAVFACLLAIESGYSAAVMAPTEILALQHQQRFLEYLSPLGVSVALLISQQKGRERQAELKKVEQIGGVIIGTHALFQQGIDFPKLGLVVVDEQHKFGVHQRLMLTQKSKTQPHQLVMTATPIPRSLTMSFYADLDVSKIDELPFGVKRTQTITVGNERKSEVVQKIIQLSEGGSQVYWVCTLIDASEALVAEPASEAASYLEQELPNLRIGLIHGRLAREEKLVIMNRFRAKELDVLVSTTVIEVGIDVPNADMIVIENAERLGLSQLHQLRGRVGRGGRQALCVLLYQKPLSANARERLTTMRESNDGFRIAEKDLELRGPGEILGTAQTGNVSMRIANVVRDKALLEKSPAYVDALLQMNEAQQTELLSRWVDLDRVQYGDV